MSEQPSQAIPVRSTFVSVVAWVFIVLTGFATLISVLQNLMINTVIPWDQMTIPPDQGGDHIPPIARFVLTHFRLIFLSFLVLVSAAFATSIALLKRRAWARIVFVAMLGLGIVLHLSGLVIQFSLMSVADTLPPNAPPDFAEGFTRMVMFMRVFAVVWTLAICALFGWIIKRLLAPEIRAEFR